MQTHIGCWNTVNHKHTPNPWSCHPDRMAVQLVQMEVALTVETIEAGVPDELVETLPQAMHASMSDVDIQQLCQKLEAQLKPPTQVRLGLPDLLIGEGAIYQVAHTCILPHY